MSNDRFRSDEYFDGLLRDCVSRMPVAAGHDRLSVAIGNLAEVIIITDVHGMIEYTNPAFQRVTGYTCKEALGQTPRMLKSGLHAESFYQAMWDALLRGETWTGQVRNRRKDGRIITAESTIVPVLDDQGSITHFVAVQRDVTTEAVLESQLRESQRLEALGTLAGGIAHDFNNILYALLGYAQLAQDELAPDSAVQSYLQEIVKAGERATGLVSKMMVFGRRVASTKEAILLQDVVAETLQLVRASLPATILIEHDLQADCPAVLADPVQIHQVLLNLCTNAGHAMNESGGTLTVELESIEVDQERANCSHGLSAGGWARLRVADTGTGIEAGLLGRLFEPYFTTKESDGGTGLGLSIVHGIVRNHGGTIEVDSHPGSGTTFTVFLPLAHAAVPESAPAAKPLECATDARILVVDDEAMIVDVAVRGLTGLGYTVTGLTDGVKAVEVIRRDPWAFDAIVTDQTMPGITGFELADQVRSLREDLPLILTTGYYSDESEERIRQAGFRRLLPKPMKIKELAAALEEILCAPAANRGR